MATGNIEKRGTNSYRLTVSAGYDIKGNRIRHRRNITAKTIREAEKELAKFITEVENGQHIDSKNLTFKDFVEKWLKEKSLAPRTMHSYKHELNKRILPALGHHSINKLKPLHLIEFYNSLKKDGVRLDGRKGGLSGKTQLYNHKIISSILNDAVRWQIISTNPAARIQPPKAKKKDIPVYNEEQVVVLLKALQNEPIKYQTAVFIDILTGLRRGEIMGLEWKDIDLQNKNLNVRQSSQYVPDIGTYTTDTKNTSSIRSISIPNMLVDLLILYKEAQDARKKKVGDKWRENDRLFTKWNGEPVHPTTISKWFPKFIERHNLPKVTFHGLRHSLATLLIHKGMNIKAISSRLGHSSATTTMNVYAHYLKSSDQEASNLMDKLFNEKQIYD